MLVHDGIRKQQNGKGEVGFSSSVLPADAPPVLPFGKRPFLPGSSSPIAHRQLPQPGKGELVNVASGLEPAEHWGPCTALKSLWLAVLAALLLASSDALPASLLFQRIPRLEAAPALPRLTRGWVGSSSWAQSPEQGEGCVLWLLMIPAVNSGMPLKVSWESYTYFCLAAGMTAVK